MGKVICLLIVVLTTSISLGQTKKKMESKPKDIDRDINFKLDSLSKVYKMKIYSYGTVSDEDGITRHFVGYIEEGKLKNKNHSNPIEVRQPQNLISLNELYLITSFFVV